MKILNLILITLYLIFCNNSFGANVNIAILRNETTSALIELEQNGINKIDGQDISMIKEQVKTIDIQTVPFLWTNTNNLGSYRASGHWSKIGNTVILAQNHLQQMNNDTRPYLVLHEMAGPLNINDDNFSKSAAIMVYKSIKQESIQNPKILHDSDALKLLKKNIELKSGGGSTGIDGGGDVRLLSYMGFLQAELIFDLIDKRINEIIYQAAYQWISSVKIEFNFSVPQGEIFYIKKSHSLLIPNNATSEFDSKLNIKRMHIFLDNLYKDLQSGHE